MDAVADALGTSPEATEQPAGEESGSETGQPEEDKANGYDHPGTQGHTSVVPRNPSPMPM